MTGLVPVDPTGCPACGARPNVVTAEAQPAIVRHGGYGATRIRVWRHCLLRCGWWLLAREYEARPR